MKKILTVAVMLAAIPTFAQSPVKSNVSPPTFSTAERIAIQAIEKLKQDAQKGFSDAQQQELSILREFESSHPGFKVNQQTFQIEAMPTPKK